MKRNDLGDILDRSTIGFRTPVNPLKTSILSPILHATTPDLSGSDFECKGTPGLIKSLGINPELDISWTSGMETPTSERSVSFLPEKKNTEISDHVLQRRNLFLDDEVISTRMMEEFKNHPSNSETCKKKLLTFLSKPSTKFIYPEPVRININKMASYSGPYSSLPKKHSPSVLKEESFPHSNTTQVPLTEPTESKKNPLFNTNQPRGFASDQHQMLDPASVQSKEDSFTTISSLKSEEKMCQEELSRIIDENPGTTIPNLWSSSFGFNTASGKKVIVSEEAVIRARAILDDLSEANFDTTQDENFQSTVKPRRETLTEKHVQIGHNPPPVMKQVDLASDGKEYHNPSTTKSLVGFNTASGKKVAISESAISRAKQLFSELEDGIHPVVDSKSEIPNMSGFCLASGKKVLISEEAVAQAQALFEDIPDKLLKESVNLPLPKTPMDPELAMLPEVNLEFSLVGLKNASSSIDQNMTGTFPLAGFSTASGKHVAISKDALKKATSLFEAISDENTSNASSLYMEVDTTERLETSTSISGTISSISTEIPRTVGFSTASGRTVKISHKGLLRAKKLFDENSSKDTASLQEISEANVDLKNPVSSIMPPKTGNNKTKINLEKMEDDCDDDWISSPTIGKKKKKNPSPSPRTKVSLTPVSGTPSLMFENTPNFVKSKVLAKRRKARHEQNLLIQTKVKKGIKTVPKISRAGYLYQLKRDPTSAKRTLKELIGNRPLPEISAPYELLQDYGMLPSVCLVQAANASTFNFFAWEHFPVEECQTNTNGFKLGEFFLILSDDNTIGIEEISASFMASENVDPSLISLEWIRNHYRWIVWKLASMELRIPSLFARTSLTPSNVLEQLKYRYDKEIDHCERSALKRIIEHDDTPAKTMILCVADIRTTTILEMTDGWYSIDVHCDNALQQLIESNKIFIGVKLAISGAELVSPGPTTPLEKGADTFLKISANSTRRARWDAKLGFYCVPSPFPVTLSSILADGGIVSHVRVNIIRVFPMIYMEKTTDGKTIFRGERQHRRLSESAASRYELMMEKIVEDIEREEDEQDRKRTRTEGGRRQIEVNLTDEEKRRRIHEEAHRRIQTNLKTTEGVPMLRLRVIDWRGTSSTSAIVSIWRPSEDLLQHLKEGRAYHLYNVNAAGIRVGELQLSAMKNTAWNEMKSHNPIPQELQRSVIPFSSANEIGFKPMFNELDVVGLVVYVGQKQVKDPFQTVVLSDGVDYFGVKCWTNLEEYALADVVVTGSFLAFSNLQWRSTASRTTSKLPFAFIHENTVVSARPAQKHLEVALQKLKESLNDPAACLSEAEVQLTNLLGSNTPQSATPKYGSANGRGGMFTPTGILAGVVKKEDTPTSSSSVTMARSRLLEKYGTPPALSPWNSSGSPHVRQRFKPPARKPPAV